MPKSRKERNDAKRFVTGMRAAGKLAFSILEEVEKFIAPGITTMDIDRLVDKLTTDAGAISAPYLYFPKSAVTPFPGHCCTSVNEVVCHGIPSETKILRNGDIINVDVTPKLAGYHGDSSRTFIVGRFTHAGNYMDKAEMLVQRTKEAMELAIAACYPNCPVTVVGDAITPFAYRHGYSIVRDYSGHGTGKVFHKEPAILHFSHFSRGPALLKPGMAFTIEPMLNMGASSTKVLNDGWTVVTEDHSLSAQWEHTLLMTPTGVEILTGGQ